MGYHQIVWTTQVNGANRVYGENKVNKIASEQGTEKTWIEWGGIENFV